MNAATDEGLRRREASRRDEARKPTTTPHSESLAELSSELDSADECSLMSAAVTPFDPPPDARPPCSNDLSFSSRARIFFVSTSSSMLFRFSPPVPVPLPVRGRLTGGFIGLMTKLYSFVNTAAGSWSISSSISSVL